MSVAEDFREEVDIRQCATVPADPPCLRASVLLSHPNRFESERLSGQ